MSSPRLDELRRQLREKFPQAHRVRPEVDIPARSAASLAQESFPAGGISEVVPAGPDAGLFLLIAGLLENGDRASPQPELILIDGADGFDPTSFTAEACSRLLWVRASSAIQMLKAADLLVRDGNLPFILLDATGLPHRELGGIPSSVWWRLKGLAGRNGSRLVVLAPFPLVPCAGLRLTLSADLSLRDFDEARSDLLERMTAVPQRSQRAT